MFDLRRQSVQTLDGWEAVALCLCGAVCCDGMEDACVMHGANDTEKLQASLSWTSPCTRTSLHTDTQDWPAH